MPFHDPRGVYVGRDVGGRDLEIRPELVHGHATGTGDRHSWYEGDSPFGGAIAPALLLHSEVYADLGWYLPNLFGNLHARQEWQLFEPMRVGESVRTRTTVVERYRRRDRDVVVAEVLVTDERGRWLSRSRTHQSFLVEDQRAGYAIDRDREKRADRAFRVGECAGADLPSFDRTITQEMCDAFSGPGRNYHNDRELARALGFPEIVVQGMMSICFVSELMTHAFGEGWFCGGRLDVNLVNVVWGGDSLAVRGRGRERTPEGAHERVTCDVWCEKPDGVKTLVGAASALRRCPAGRR